MDQEKIVLAGLAPAKGDFHTPVQVQKLFFLIDKNIPEWVDGPHFDFVPYNYGPFDSSIYRVLEKLEVEGLVEIVSDGRLNQYKLTPEGQKSGDKYLSGIGSKAKDYIKRTSKFVRTLSFTQLVSAIYRAYPEMRENSVFQA